jgi:hypothetical protein
MRKAPLYSLNRSVGETYSRYGSFGKKKNLIPLPGIEGVLLCFPARNVGKVDYVITRFSK